MDKASGSPGAFFSTSVRDYSFLTTFVFNNSSQESVSDLIFHPNNNKTLNKQNLVLYCCGLKNSS